MHQCACCAAQSPQMLQCSRCKSTTYCSPACQRAAWKKHKKSCQEIKGTEPPITRRSLVATDHSSVAPSLPLPPWLGQPLGWRLRGHAEAQEWQKVVDMHHEVLDEAHRTKSEHADDTGYLLLNIGEAFSYLGRHAEAADVLEQGLQHVRAHPEIRYNGLLDTMSFMPASNLKLEEGFFPPLGQALCASGRFQQALELHKESQDVARRELLERHPLLDAESVKHLAQSLDCKPEKQWVAQALLATGEPEKAIERLIASLQKVQDMSCKIQALGFDKDWNTDLFQAHLHLGVAYESAGKFGLAIELLEKCTKLWDQIPTIAANPSRIWSDTPQGQLGEAQLHLGRAYLGFKDVSKALKALEQARKIHQQVGDVKALCETLLELAASFFLRARLAQSDAFAASASSSAAAASSSSPAAAGKMLAGIQIT